MPKKGIEGEVFVIYKNQNQTLQLEFGNVQFNYGDFLLLFEHDFFLQKTQNFTIGFR